MKISIIGSGIGGLTAACLLSHDGHDVTVYEKNGHSGGKINTYEEKGFSFDIGPHVLTMPWVFSDFFDLLELDESKYFSYKKLDPQNTFTWEDGTKLIFSEDLEKTFQSIFNLRKKESDVENFKKYLEYCQELFNYTKENFLTVSPKSKLNPKSIISNFGFLKHKPWENIEKRNGRDISESHLREALNLFALYSGSDPRKTSSVFNVIAHIQFKQGLRYIEGGINRISNVFENIAREKGVKFEFNSEVRDVQRLKSDIVISNADSFFTLEKLLGKTLPKNVKYSTSAFIILLGVNKKYEQLEHHNSLMTDDPELEIHEIFDKNIPPSNPTIGIDVQTKTDQSRAPDECDTLFIMVNPPANTNGINWEEYKVVYADMILSKIKKAYRLEDLEQHIIVKKIITPDDIEKMYNQHYGAIYGTSSEGIFGTLARPQNKVNESFYLVGGSTHPGGGMPMCMLSAMIVRNMIKD